MNRYIQQRLAILKLELAQVRDAQANVPHTQPSAELIKLLARIDELERLEVKSGV